MKVFLHTASLLALVIMIGVISVSPAGSITSLSGVHGCSSSLHLLSNAFLCISALPEFLAAEFQPSGSPVASQIFVGCFELLIFFTGLSSLLRASQHTQSPFPYALSSTVLLLWLTGFDSIYLPSYMFIPWFAFGVLTYKTPLQGLLVAGVSILLVLSSGALSIFSLSVALLLAHVSSPSQFTWHKQGLWKVVCFALFLALVIPAIGPLPEFPNYPLYARVVSDDGMSGHVYPLITRAFPLPIINREALGNLYGPAALILLSFTSLLFFFSRRTPQLAVSFIAATLVAIDTLAPESIAVIAPLETLRRLLPDLFFVSLTPAVFTASIFFFLSALLALVPSDLLKAAVLIFIALFPLFEGSSTFQSLGASRFSEAVERASSDGVSPQMEKILTSPSLPLLRDVDFASLNRFQNLHLVSPRKAKATVTASHNEDLLRKIFDRNPKTRWSPKTGEQRGGEYLELSFPESVTLHGIELSPGAFSSDYPRGIRFDAWLECADRAHPISSFTVEPWNGPIEVTIDGFPYIGPPNHVRLMLPVPAEGRCFRLTQTGKAQFDWSVASLKVSGKLGKKKGTKEFMGNESMSPRKKRTEG